MTYDRQQTNTFIFDELSKTGCKYFLTYVKLHKRERIKDPATFNTAQSMVDLTNLHTNYKSTGLWHMQRNDAKSIKIKNRPAKPKYQQKRKTGRY